jgi:hypothetical protein
MVLAFLHGGVPTIFARAVSARQSRRQGRFLAVRRCWDTMVGAWIGTLLLERPGVEVDDHVHRNQVEGESFARAWNNPRGSAEAGLCHVLMIGDAAFGPQVLD